MEFYIFNPKTIVVMILPFLKQAKGHLAWLKPIILLEVNIPSSSSRL